MKIIEKMQKLLKHPWETQCRNCGYFHGCNMQRCPECGEPKGGYKSVGDRFMKLEIEFEERYLWRIDNMIKNGKYPDRESAVNDAVKRLIATRG